MIPTLARLRNEYERALALVDTEPTPLTVAIGDLSRGDSVQYESVATVLSILRAEHERQIAAQRSKLLADLYHEAGRLALGEL